MRSIVGVGITPPNVEGAPKPTSSVMISRMLGAPAGGTILGGHHDFDWAAFRLMVPPNGRAGAGSTSPGIVRVPSGEPTLVPVGSRAGAEPAAGAAAPVCAFASPESHVPPNEDSRAAFAVDRNNCRRFTFIWSPHFVLFVSCAAHSGNRCGSLSCQLLAESAPRACSAGSNWARRDTSRP